MRGSFHRSPSLADTEEERPRPMHADDPAGDPGQRPVALAPIFETVAENADRVRMSTITPQATRPGTTPICAMPLPASSPVMT
jgi:hypothetical protein